jgi:hypothetical protein
VKQTKETVEKLGNLLAELDEDSPLPNDMHIVSIQYRSALNGEIFLYLKEIKSFD